MKKRNKLLSGIILSIGVIGAILSPIKANALASSDSGNFNLIYDKETPSDLVGVIRPQMAYFTLDDETRCKWYGKDSSTITNMMYYQTYKGMSWYSPVPIGKYWNESKTTSYSQMYENAHRRESVGASWTLYDKSYCNFKKYSAPINDASLNNLTTNSGYTNYYDPYKGVNGEWRYMGYSIRGNVITNPYFPSDVSSSYTLASYPWDLHPWNYSRPCPDGATAWDNVDGQNSEYYQIKIQAITKLLEQEPTMKSVSSDPYYWAERLSLRTDPTVETGIFVGSRGGGSYYRTVALAPPEQYTRNLRLTEMVVRDANTYEILGYAQRNESDPNNVSLSTNVTAKLMPGETYLLTAKVKNMSGYETYADVSKLDVANATGQTALSNSANYSDSQIQDTVEKEEKFAPYETKDFEWEFVVDDTAEKYVRVSSFINGIHTLCQDNTDPTDDDASLIFKVGGGNFGIDKIKLVGRDGKEYDRATPGEDYKIRYYVKYTGPDVKVAVYRTVKSCHTSSDGGKSCSTKKVFDHWEYPEKSIPLNIEIYRNIPPVYNYAEKYTETIPKKSEIRNGTTYVYTTSEYRTYEVPAIKTVATVSSQIAEFEQSSDAGDESDNQLSAEWNEKYDIAVSDVKILPLTERPYVAGYQTFAVQYTITSTAPKWLTTYEKDVLTSVKIKDVQETTKVHVEKGDNTQITQEMKVWIDPNTDRNITATVYANYDKMTWEQDVFTQKNNIAEGSATIALPPNPYSGACSMNGVKTSNNWTQKYNIHKWTGIHKTYKAVDGSKHEFNQYSSAGSTTQSMSQSESYNITSIKFRSKLTTDTNQGTDGWVELKGSQPGMIKAGYGYELKITVNYKTNAFNQPSFNTYGTYLENGNWVRPYNVEANLPNELFVKTPDGQILSVSGYANTNAGLEYTRTGDKSNTTWVYTLKSKDTLGIKSVPKIFIDENTKDGIYDLQIFTPEINGVPTKTSGGITMCDSQTVQIQVKGSNTDDLNSHITQ